MGETGARLSRRRKEVKKNLTGREMEINAGGDTDWEGEGRTEMETNINF